MRVSKHSIQDKMFDISAINFKIFAGTIWLRVWKTFLTNGNVNYQFHSHKKTTAVSTITNTVNTPQKLFSTDRCVHVVYNWKQTFYSEIMDYVTSNQRFFCYLTKLLLAVALITEGLLLIFCILNQKLAHNGVKKTCWCREFIWGNQRFPRQVS